MPRLLAVGIALVLSAVARAQTHVPFTAELPSQTITVHVPKSPAWECEYLRTFAAEPGTVASRTVAVAVMPGWIVTDSDGHMRGKRVSVDDDTVVAGRTEFPLTSLFRLKGRFGPSPADCLTIEIGAFGHGGVAAGSFYPVETEQAGSLIRRVQRTWLKDHRDAAPWASKATRLELLGTKVYRAEHAAHHPSERRTIAGRVYGFAIADDTYLIQVAADASVLAAHAPEVDALVASLRFGAR